jgi:hypothetical protein
LIRETLVMAGLVPAIHVFYRATLQDVDARHKAGHDDIIQTRNDYRLGSG